MKIKIFLTLFLLVSFSFAQSERENEFNLYGNYSPDSNTLFSIARTKDARLRFFNIEYARTFYKGKKMSLKYTASFIPFASLDFPTSHRSGVRIKAHAFGIAPVGLKLQFASRKKIKPFVALSVGVLFFDKPIPNNLGKKLNFTADLGGGIEVSLGRSRSLMFGYKYYHISNANRGLINPGFDNNIFFVGYRFFSK